MKKKRANKRGFTLIELILVLVVSTILSSIAISKINSNSLMLAARNVLNDLYYLQYLAINYDVYNGFSNYDNSYFQIYFHCVANIKTSYNKYKCNHKEIGYSIFSDKIGTNTSNPDADELVQDLFDSSKLIGARFAGISIDDKLLSNKANLTKAFNIKNAEIFYKANNKTRKANRLMVNELGEFYISSYVSKLSKYNLIKSSDYVIRLSNSNIISKDTSICISLNNVGFINIPKMSEKGQIVWYSGIKKTPKYCHELNNK